jgi:hypothetical protein
MLIVCKDGCYSDTDVLLIEHDDEAEALAALKLLEPAGPEIVCTATTYTLCDQAPSTLLTVLGGYLHFEPHRWVLFEKLPTALLRAVVEQLAVANEKAADSPLYQGNWQSDDLRSKARDLREALFLREQRDRIAADLADMERIGAMTVEPDAAPPN